MAANSVPSDEKKILVIEDDREIRELMTLLLQRQNYQVIAIANPVEGLQKLEQIAPSLIVLDWMLPELSGIEFLRKKEYPVPVLMVTAKSTPDDIVMGLEAGADDYIVKPFDAQVFTARVRALIRRSKKTSHENSREEQRVQIGGLCADFDTCQVTCGEQELSLTASEYKLVRELMKNPGRVLTRDHLVKVIQGEGVSVTGRTIDTHVFGLRKKLLQCADFIETVRGIGYRVRAE